MSKVLYDTDQGIVYPYNRADGQSVAGLAPHIVVLDVVAESAPETVPDGFEAQAAISIDLPNKRYINTWNVVPRSPKRWNSITEFWHELPEHTKNAMCPPPTSALTRLHADLLAWRYDVVANHPSIVGGVSALVSAGLMTAEEAETLLGAPLP